MALAIQFDQLISDGIVANQAELARLGHVSRARLTQVMNLINLAPDIQRLLLHLSGTSKRAPTERELRSVIDIKDWQRQRLLFVAALKTCR